MLGRLFRTKQVPSDYPVKLNDDGNSIDARSNVQKLVSRFESQRKGIQRGHAQTPPQKTVAMTFDEAFGSWASSVPGMEIHDSEKKVRPPPLAGTVFADL